MENIEKMTLWLGGKEVKPFEEANLEINQGKLRHRKKITFIIAIGLQLKTLLMKILNRWRPTNKTFNN